jgi:hypothetical protein
MKDKVIIHYSNGKSYTLRNYKCEAVKWDFYNLGIVREVPLARHENVKTVKIPLFANKKFLADDVVAVESITDGKRIIHTRPGVDMSIHTDIKTAKRRCKQNRSEFYLELTDEDLAVFGHELHCPTNLQWYSPTPESIEVRNTADLGNILDSYIAATGDSAVRAYAENYRKFLEDFSTINLDKDFEQVLSGNKWSLYEDTEIDLEMSKSKAILFNGPAGCGKDSAISYLEEHLYVELTRRECKDRLHELTMEYFNVEPELYWKLYNSRELKEMPSVYYALKYSEYSMLRNSVEKFEYACGGVDWYVSPRMAMIFVSECIVKPEHGEDYFGKHRAEQAEKYGEVMVDGSCAAFEVNGEIRANELDALVDKLGAENILVIKVKRPGFSFNEDSRRYIPDGYKGIQTLSVLNMEGQEEFYNRDILDKVTHFLEN